jgi:hypothetical protein
MSPYGSRPTRQWVRTEEFWDQATAAEVLPFLGEVTALARRARQAGERLYCWICLSRSIPHDVEANLGFS